MKRYVAITAAMVLVALAAWGIAAAAETTTNITYPNYRNAYAYFINGETWQILFEDSFGAVVYNPLAMGDHKLTVSMNDTRIETSAGLVKITRTHSGVVDITYPKGAAKISSTVNEVRLLFKGKTYTMKRQMNDYISAEVPGDVITYKAHPGMGELTVSGKEGSASYRRNLNDFTITSKAGTTKYTTIVSGGYTLAGVPATKHPYRYWGVEFLIPECQMGIVMELGSYISIEGFPRLLDFDGALIVK